MPLKAIVTGLGGQGRGWTKFLHQQRQDIDVVACVEPSAANAERAVADIGIDRRIIHPTLADALASVRADFVCDVTPPSVHHEVAEAAFAAGLHVLEEKPLSDDFARACRVVELGRRAKRRHMITQNYRFSGQPRTTRKLLSEGVIGKPGQCDVRFYMSWADMAGSHYVTQPYMLINDMMVHHFDMMRYVLGVEPESVHAITWNQPWGWHKGDAAHAIVFRYPDGLVATHVSCGCAVGSRTPWNGDWRIEGPKGSITWDERGMRRHWLHRAEKTVDEAIESLKVPDARSAIVDEFLASIREERDPECSAADNLHSLAMVFAAIASAKEGRTVALQEIWDAVPAPARA